MNFLNLHTLVLGVTLNSIELKNVPWKLSEIASVKKNGLKVFGTENHLMVVEVGLEKGKDVAVKLEENGIVVNANTVPHEQGSPFKPSGIRMGTPAITTRGMKAKEMKTIAGWINEVISNPKSVKKVRAEIKAFTKKFPLPK